MLRPSYRYTCQSFLDIFSNALQLDSPKQQIAFCYAKSIARIPVLF